MTHASPTAPVVITEEPPIGAVVQVVRDLPSGASWIGDLHIRATDGWTGSPHLSKRVTWDEVVAPRRDGVVVTVTQYAGPLTDAGAPALASTPTTDDDVECVATTLRDLYDWQGRPATAYEVAKHAGHRTKPLGEPTAEVALRALVAAGRAWEAPSAGGVTFYGPGAETPALRAP